MKQAVIILTGNCALGWAGEINIRFKLTPRRTVVARITEVSVNEAYAPPDGPEEWRDALA